MNANPIKGKRLFVLDTNVLMHDPTALFRFKEHDIFLPMIVLEELDGNKKGSTEVARNARQTSRFLDDMMTGVTPELIAQGIEIKQAAVTTNGGESSGRLFFQTQHFQTELPVTLPGKSADNDLLGTVLSLQKRLAQTLITVVSKDINLRIKASVLGIHAEDYNNDQVLEDVDLLYTGAGELDKSFWDKHAKNMDSWVESGHTFYRVEGPNVAGWYPNQFVYHSDDEFDAVVREVHQDSAIIETVRDYRSNHKTVWGIHARNREQNYALNLLMDTNIDFVSMVGSAGTGKTLLALAAGLEQTLEKNLYREIIMTRVTIPVGEDIGFLPGTEEEKMTPWMGALMDNLEVLTGNGEGGSWGRAATQDILAQRIKIRSVNFMRGRTFLNRFVIIDEAQNLTSKQLKTLITRAGPGTKLICLGNIAQIDTPYLTETTSGLTYVVDRFKGWAHSGHVTLRRGERSRLADHASEIL
ncbi:MAG: PhoH family protein [Gammaproteobacteria bacterium]|nr:PhoH family protein [Gammaproteobacteria bacterium]